MNEKIRIYLKTGGIVFSREASEIKTVLGSCVSVCLWDFKYKSGAMNHFIFPTWTGRGLATPKYGNVAMESIYEKMLSNGSRSQDLIAKIFGGGRLFTSGDMSLNPGEQNIASAKKFLARVNIPVISEDTGGARGRTVIFHTDTGDVFVKKN
ncbi:MAG: chemotaxis protein CheD [Desulfobacteraceae bacterium]|nr:chemotaxis protein CheD [Desulfobacteraceae bacterium]MCB9494293.1 chemotaxis protein CheD [Desulfobacteraceae bacterium]